MTQSTDIRPTSAGAAAVTASLTRVLALNHLNDLNRGWASDRHPEEVCENILRLVQYIRSGTVLEHDSEQLALTEEQKAAETERVEDLLAFARKQGAPKRSGDETQQCDRQVSQLDGALLELAIAGDLLETLMDAIDCGPDRAALRTPSVVGIAIEKMDEAAERITRTSRELP